MSNVDQARRKEDTVSGKNVNYYLVVITLTDGEELTVEVEDIIESLGMSFALGNVFKAVVRICKLRQDLGKPGSSALYEGEKIFYYSKRTLVVAKRRLKAMSGVKLWFHNVRLAFGSEPKLDRSLYISDPKRLDPYQFNKEDFIDALAPTNYERIVLRSVFDIAELRMKTQYHPSYEIDTAHTLCGVAESLETREKLAKAVSEKA